MTGITLDDIRRVNPDGLHHAATALGNGARDLTVQHEHYVQTTEYPVSGGHAWSGQGQAHAKGVTDATAAAIDGVHQRLEPAAIVLNGFANYLTTAKRKLAGIDRSADNLHVQIGNTGGLTIHHIAGETSTHRSVRAASAGVLQREARALLVLTAGLDNLAKTSLGRLNSGDLTTPPSPQAVERDFWKQPFDRPSFFQDMIGSLKSLALPDLDKGSLAFGLWALDRGVTFGTSLANWQARLTYAQVVPRGTDGSFLPRKNASWVKKAWWAMDKKNWSAKPGNAEAWARWQEKFGGWSKVAGRGSVVLSFAGSAYDQWSHDTHRCDLSTSEKVTRAAYRGGIVAGSAAAGAEAGAEIGAAIGTAIEPGGGTVVGGALGLVGGAAGGAAGDWFADQTLNHHHEYNPRYYDPSHPGNAPGAL